MAGVRNLRYWCGDPFTPTMLRSALNGESWKATINSRFSISNRYANMFDEKIREDFEELLQRKGRFSEHFGSRGDFDVFAEKQNNILCIEIKTKIFSTKRRKEYAKYHFDSYPGCIEALLKLPKTTNEKISSACELLKYCLKLLEYKKQSKCHIVVVVPFYISPIELQNIPLYLKRLRQYVINHYDFDIAMALWCLVASLNKWYPEDVTIYQIWKSVNFKITLPSIKRADIMEGNKKLSSTNYQYGNCADCNNRIICENRLKSFE